MKNIGNNIYDKKIPDMNQYFDMDNISILIAESDIVNQELMKGLLNEFVTKLEFVNNGLEAVQKVTNNYSYDLILLDIQLPVMNGLEACKSIRDNNIYTPIIALTTDILVTDRHKYLNVGINDFLTKPFNSKNMFQLVSTWIKQNRVYQETLDFEQIISIFGNNMNMLIDIADSFFDRYKNILFSEMSKEYVHKLKGSSGTMGLKKIMEISIKLHNNIDNMEYKKELIESFESTKKIFNELFVRKSKDLSGDINTLYDLLSENSAVVISYFLEREKYFKELFKTDYEKQKEFIINYNFSNALVICKKSM